MKKGLLAPQNTFLDTIATRFDGTHSNFVLGNAQATGCPVVYCSDGFVELSGFPRSQVMGRSCACKFLFGDNTTPMEKEKIESALENKTELKTELQFYKKGGHSFKCLLDIVPITNEKSQVVLILVSHKDIGAKEKPVDEDQKSSSENDSDDEMAEAYRRCQARRGRATGAPSRTTGYNNQRRRSRAVLYHLSGQFEKQNRAKSKLQQFNKVTQQFSSINGKMPEYKVQEVKKSKFILVHYGIFKIGWDWLILLCTFYTAILVPYNAAFTRPEKKSQRESIYSDVVVEILFIFDIVFNFRTSFVNKSGQVVYQGRLIAMNYVRGWFLLDLLAAIPFDFLFIFDINANAPVHLLKLARLLRLARLLQKIDRFSQYSALVLGLLMSMFTLIAHWLACGWYAIGHVEFNYTTAGWLYELSERLDLNTGIHVNHSANETFTTVKPDVLTSYLSALYFCCSSLTSVGFGNVSANTNSEKIFSICAMIIGALMHAVVFGNVTALIQRMYARRANFHSKTKDLKDFFRAYDIPKPLKQRMQEYFQTMWSMNNGLETAEILKDFPEEMKGELGLHLHKEILNLPIFEDATQGCLKSIALHTRRSFCAPGEFIVHKGDAANYLYLLVSGSMEILKMEMVVAILGKGDLFGADIDFDDPISVCNYDVRSLTYSELQCISIKGLTDVLVLYPEFAERFSKDIHNDLTYNLRQTAEDSDEDTTSSPKTRICTLPSISEDDEMTDSDDEQEISKVSDKFLVDDDQETTNLIPNMQLNSPVLPVFRQPIKIPNGELPMDALNSPPSTRGWVNRRVGGQFSGISRSSLKEPRKRLGSLQTGSDPVTEKIIPHVQNLQNEVEGTKSAIAKLERKVCKIGQDICAIDRNMRQILKHLTNASKMSPLEPLPPPDTPNTPFTGRGQCMFNYADTDTNPLYSQNTKPNILSFTERDNFPTKPIPTDDSTPQQTQTKVDTVSPSDSSKTENQNSVSHQFRSKNRSSFRSVRPPNDNHISELPLLLNPHDPLTRRHSDGLDRSKVNTVSGNMPTAKSDYAITTNTGDYSIKENNRDDSTITFANPKCTQKDPSFYQTPYLFQTHINTSGNSGPKLMSQLTEVHSNGCNQLDTMRTRSYTDDAICPKPVNKRKVRKSVTCGNLRVNPALKVDTGERVVTKCLETEITMSPVKSKSFEGLKCDKNNSGILLNVQTVLSPILASPIKSKSCHEMASNSSGYMPEIHAHGNKVHNYDIFETEFGAKTPNEVRTKMFRSRTSVNKMDMSDGSNMCESNNTLDSLDHSRNNTLSRQKDNHEPLSSRDDLSVEKLPRVPSLDLLRPVDSGNASLMEILGDDTEKCPNDKTKTTDTMIVFDECGIPSHQLNHNGNVGDCKWKLDSNENTNISPDSTTDISESLKTDSVKTDDGKLVDIKIDISSKDLANGSVDFNLLRTTDC